MVITAINRKDTLIQAGESTRLYTDRWLLSINLTYSRCCPLIIHPFRTKLKIVDLNQGLT